MNKNEFNEGLLGFLDASPTPFHATNNMSMMFINAGFIKLHEEQKWNLEHGKKYYVTRNDSSIIAFTYPQRKNYTMVGAHTDSPNLKLKPSPVIKEHGIVKFGVEPYGGLLLNPWFDRDLSLAGRVSYLNSQNIIKDALINVEKAIAVIPSLAIHLDDKANKDRTINKQTDMCPILTTNDDFDFEDFLKWQLSKLDILDVKELYASELSLYDMQKASMTGLNDDFISSARLDNLLSCYVGMLSICSVEDDKPMLFIASEYMNMISTSIMISADNAHAVHPNYSDKHDKNHAPNINKGSVIKVNANQRYASNSKTISRFMNVASSLNEPIQQFVTRSDMGCGSTIGPITATRLGIDTLDVGLPTLAMHSIRELCGSDDAYSLYKIILGFSD